ncbi:MAG: plasmid maintenance system killer protein [Proteobacteria bacterium]|nr:MAG: plasmid maintenance system killer protein [Pseudomonadota bacterium]
MTIQSFACSDTENFFNTGSTAKFTSIQRTAERKLMVLNSAKNLQDLKATPGNRLHALKDDRDGQHAIRINDQYRICFIWTAAGPEKVEITDYH